MERGRTELPERCDRNVILMIRNWPIQGMGGPIFLNPN